MITVQIILKENVIYANRFKNLPIGDVLVTILNDMTLLNPRSLLEPIYEDHFRGSGYIFNIHKILSTWLIMETRPMVSMVRKTKVGRRTVYRRNQVCLFDHPYSLLSDFILQSYGMNYKILNIYANCYECGNVSHSLGSFLQYHQHCSRQTYDLISPIISEYATIRKYRYNRMKPIYKWLYYGWWRKMWMMRWLMNILPKDIIGHLIDMMKKIYSISLVQQ